MVAQGEFYTINHDSQVMLKTEEKKPSERTYYEDKNWTNCIMYLKGNEKPVEYAGKIDYYNSCLDLNISGHKRSVLMTELDSFNVVDKQYYSSNLFGSDDNQLLELVQGGSISLLKSYKVKFKKANHNKVTGTGNKKDSYLVSNDYYFLNSNKQLIEIPTSSKSFNKVLGKFRGAKAIVKRNSLDPKKEIDLVLLVNQLNKN